MADPATPTGEQVTLTDAQKDAIRTTCRVTDLGRYDSEVWTAIEQTIEQILAERKNQWQHDIDAALQQTAFSKVVSQMPFVRYQRAKALREAADDWDDPSDENRADLTQLAQDEYRVGGPSMPAIWLRRRADETEGDPR